MKRKGTKICAVAGAILLTMTACSNTATESEPSVVEGTTLPVDAYMGDVKYSYSVNEDGETVTVVMPETNDKFTETMTEATAVTEINTKKPSESTVNDITSNSNNDMSGGDEKIYERFEKKNDVNNQSKIYPLKAVKIPDTFDFTSIRATTGYTEKVENDVFVGYEPVYTDIDLTKETVLSMGDYGFDYRAGNMDVQEYLDDNFYFWGCNFDYACLEAVEDNVPVSNWNSDDEQSFDKPLKAFMTIESEDSDVIFGNCITTAMHRDEIEAILGRGYEVDYVDELKNEKGTTVYYQNSKGAFIVGYIGKYTVNFIAVVIKDDGDKCIEVPQPEQIQITTTAVSEPTKEDVSEQMIYECSSFKGVYQKNNKTNDEYYIFYIYKKDMDVVDKAVYDSLIDDYTESGYNIVIVD